MSDELEKLRNIMSREIVGELRTHAVIQQVADTIFDRAADEIVRLQQQIVLLRAERDAVRREICDYVSSGAVILGQRPTWQEYAAERGWDFRKDKP